MTPDDVRGIFEGLVEARGEMDRIRHRLEALKSPTISSGIARAAHGGVSDPTAMAGSALADEAGELARAETRYRSILGEVDELIYGLRVGMGTIYADILDDRYVRGLAYETIAQLNDVSRSSVYRYRETAFDAIASVGLPRAKDGDFGLIANPEGGA